MDMRFQGKTRRRAGFTLAETLLATLILSLVAVLLTTGVPYAKRAYGKVVNGANARLLLSNTVTALRNELGTATDIKVNIETNTIEYYSTDIHSWSRIYPYVETADARVIAPVGAIMLQQYTNVVDDPLVSDDKKPLPRRLVTSSASNGNLYVTFDGIEYNRESALPNSKIIGLTIKGLKVLDAKDDTPETPYVLVKLDDLVIHPVVGPVLGTTTAPTEESGAGSAGTPDAGT